MKSETLHLLPEFIGTGIYESAEQGPRQVNGKPGTYVRHNVYFEKHGLVGVITPASSSVIESDQRVQPVNPLLYFDYINGRNTAPAKNILAEKLEVVK